ncbi:MAG TPA: Uma2 family endonuclease [Pirellulales bacterium]|nr:Uma2 family endonuclease [Pirellulales bacterium]
MSTSTIPTHGELVFDGFRVPAGVFDFERFQEWIHGDDFPEAVRACYIAGHVEIEMDPRVVESEMEMRGIAAAAGDSDRHKRLAEIPTPLAGELVFNEFRVPAEVFDFEKFLDWVNSDEFPENVRATYIDGHIEVEMSPEEIETHNKLKGAVHASLWHWNSQRQLGEVLEDGARLVHPETKFSAEPDVMFCSWAATESGRVRYAEQVKGSNRFVQVVGSPDLVVEVVSRSSVRKDGVLLREQYFQAGIQEYWQIDGRGETIEFQLLARGQHEFQPVAADADGYRRSEALGGSFLLTRSLNRAGRFDYRLSGRD